MEMRTADKAPAALLQGRGLDAITVAIGAGVHLAGDLSPDEVLDHGIFDLILDELDPPLRVGAEDLDDVLGPTIVARRACGHGLAVCSRGGRTTA